MRNGSGGHYPEPNMTHYTFTQEKNTDGEIVNLPHPNPNLSTNLKDAILRIGKAEMFDKTWILLVILGISWSKWHNDDPEHEHLDDIDEITGEVSRIVKVDGK